jgi:hypothetical protein
MTFQAKPYFLVALACSCLSASSCRRKVALETDGWSAHTSLSSPDAFPEPIRPAISAAIAELARRGENPGDFFARVERGDQPAGGYYPFKTRDGGRSLDTDDPRTLYVAGTIPQPHVLVIHLSHLTASLPMREHRHNDAGWDTSGLDMHFDTVQKRIVSVGYWQ